MRSVETNDVRGRFNCDRIDVLQRARAEGLKRPVKLAQIKYLLGGLLLQLSGELHRTLNGEVCVDLLERMTPVEKRYKLVPCVRHIRESAKRDPIKCRLKSTDIKRLYDAVAIDTGKGDFDPDFAGDKNAVLKRLNRNTKLWPTLGKVDKRRAA